MGVAVAGVSVATIASVASAAVGIAGTVMSMTSAQAGAKANSNAAVAQQNAAVSQQNAANYSAQVAENNKKIAEQNRDQAIQRGETVNEQVGMKAAGQLADIQAAQGASGVDVNTGSAPMVRQSARVLSETDAQTIRANAAKEAYGWQTEANSQGSQAGLDRTQAGYYGTAAGGYGAASKDALAAGDMAAGGGLLAGASGVGSKFASWLQQNKGDTGGPAEGSPASTGMVQGDRWAQEGFGT